MINRVTLMFLLSKCLNVKRCFYKLPVYPSQNILF